MANKPLKSIKFPGLPDTYTVPQVDSVPTQGSANAVQSGGVYSELTALNAKVGTLANLTTEEKTDLVSAINELDSCKAENDGYYEEMTVGDAEQLVATHYVEDSVPYLFRTTGGSADVGDRQYADTIVGGTIVWNQLVTIPTSDKSISQNGVTVTDNRDGTFSVVTDENGATANTNVNITAVKFISGHKYLWKGTPTGGSAETYYSYLAGTTVASLGGQWKEVGDGILYSASSTDFAYPVAALINSGTVISNSIKFKPQLFDLTQMFGSTIADYIYSLEQANGGDGVAWFRKLFPRDYYEYNPGELKSVEDLSSHDTVGFNAYNPTTGTAILLGGNQYQITGAYTSLSYSTGETITPDSDGLFTPTNNGTLTVTGGNSTDTCVHLTWSGYRNGEYEAYEKHSYALDDSLTLRGIPKLDASNNLYYDGDTYEYDGTVTRKYGIVDLGTLTWAYDSNSSIFTASVSGIKSGTYIDSNLVCSKYPLMPMSYSLFAYGIRYNSSTSIGIKDSAYSDAATFTTAMSGVYLVYELATETTETASAYTQYQICDDFGTEEFVSTGIVPVGHETRYPANLRDKVQHLPDLADSDGTYLVSQSNKQMSLIPYSAPTGLPTAPTDDGTYVLKATVANGAVTYTWEAEA